MLNKVFILDHNSAWSNFAAKTLVTHSYDAIEFGCRDDVIAQLKSNPTQECNTMVIVDTLSDLTENNMIKSLEVARTIVEHYPKIALVVTSSRPTADEAVSAFNAGSLAYIPKTFDNRQLMELLTQAIHSHSTCD